MSKRIKITTIIVTLCLIFLILFINSNRLLGFKIEKDTYVIQEQTICNMQFSDHKKYVSVEKKNGGKVYSFVYQHEDGLVTVVKPQNRVVIKETNIVNIRPTFKVLIRSNKITALGSSFVAGDEKTVLQRFITKVWFPKATSPSEIYLITVPKGTIDK